MSKSLIRGAANRILALIARFGPGATSLRPLLHKLRGVHITGKVFIGDDVYLENEYPEQIELHDGAQITVRCTLIAHTRGAGRIVVGKNAFLGAGCILTAPAGRTLKVGECAVITAGSVISSDVPAYTVVGTERAKPLAKVTIPLSMETSYEEFALGLRPLRAASQSPQQVIPPSTVKV